MTLACFHCDQALPKGFEDSYTLVHEGRSLTFCCPACQAIAEAILLGGFDQYYAKREGETLRPDEAQQDYRVWDESLLQEGFVSVEDNLNTIKLYIEGLHCTACAWLIEQHLLKQEAITDASVNYQQGLLTVKQDKASPVSELMTQVARIGYKPHPYQDDHIQQAHAFEKKKQIKRLGITALLMMQLGMLAAGVYAGDYLGISAHHRQLLHVFGLLFSLPLLYVSGLPFFVSACKALQQQQVNMDVNIALAIVGLYGGSLVSVYQGVGDVYFDSIAMLCFFILLARFIEFTSRASLRFTKPLLPRFIRLVNQETVLLESVQVGDQLIISPGDMIPVDGLVLAGSSTVNESMLTGESTPVSKVVGDKLLAGSENYTGVLTAQVLTNAGQSSLDRLEQLTESTQLSEQTQNDYWAALFTGLIALLAFATYVVWLFIEPDRAFWVGLSVLVISCPCALSLASPTAKAVMQANLRKLGVIIRTPSVLEQAASIDTVFVDKTGTLTQGQLSVQKIENHSDFSDEQLLILAASLEQATGHPIASAFSEIVASSAEEIEVFPSKGVSGIVNHQRYYLGSAAFCGTLGDVPIQPYEPFQWIGLCKEGQFLAWIGLTDAIREDSLAVVNQLTAKGIEVEILSGDGSVHVKTVADTLSLPYQSSLTPEDKLAAVQAAVNKGKQVLMLGDGLNDSVGLAGSHVSVTLDNAQDWTKSRVGVVLNHGKLSGILSLLAGAKAYKRTYRQNIVWALAYNALAIPLAMAGFITPLFAALGMSLSSIVVVLNARRLK